MNSIGLSLLANCAIVTLVHAATLNVIYSFEGGADGEYADTDLVRDGAGNLYGTTVQGGAHASGTVWRLHPNGDGSWAPVSSTSSFGSYTRSW